MFTDEDQLIVADKNDIDFNDKFYNNVVESENSSSSSKGHVDDNEKPRKSQR